MQVTIYSCMATLDPERDWTWTGDVPDGTTLERLFRLFNRVDELDGPRLERMGYRLPSLTAGDVVKVSGEEGGVWLCADMGWTELRPFKDPVPAWLEAKMDAPHEAVDPRMVVTAGRGVL